MNHVYRIVFNRALGVMQVASELASHRGGGRGGSPRRRPQLPTLLALALMLAAGGAGAQVAPSALPTGPNVVEGLGGITSDGTTMTITQDQARALIRWDTFNIGADAAVVFEQTAGQMALNQILDASASQIMGDLTAGGTIFLINPNGIVFGAGARVDVGALVASTLVPDDDMRFVERAGGEYVHNSLTWAQTGTAGLVSNAGTINAANGAVLLGSGVRNEAGGTIDVGTGRAALLAGGTAQLALEPGRAPSVLITQNASAIPAGASSGVSNAGAIFAQGGTIELTGWLAAGLAATAVNNTGVLSAGGIAVGADGSISLQAIDGDLHAGGTIDAGGGRAGLHSTRDIALSAALTSGPLDVIARSLTQTGGTVRASGRSSVTVTGDATLDSAGNDFDVLALDARGTVSVVDADGLSVETGQAGAVDGDLTVRSTGELQLAGTVYGSLSATSNGGAIYTGPLLVGGALSVISGGGDITEIANRSDVSLWVGGASTLDAGSGIIQLYKNHDFRGRVDVTGRTVGLLDVNALDLGTVDVSSNMIVIASGLLSLGQGSVGGELTARSATGGITQAGALSIGGPAIINAGAGGNITLAHADNDFAGIVRLTGRTATVRDANALTLGELDLTNLTATSTGALSLGNGLVRDALSATSAGGAITQSGALTVSGTARVDAGAGAITLDNAGNNFAGTLHLDGAAVSVRDADALRLGTTVADSLTVNSGGALTLGTTQVGGTLAATSASGGITQAGALSVGGASTINAGAGAITLDNDGNDFAGTLRLVAADARVHDSNALQLTSVDVRSLHASSGGRMVLGGRVGGQLIATSAAGGIGQDAVALSGALTVQGAASFDAGMGAITLDNMNNDFSGPVALAGGAVTIRDTNTLGLGQLDVASLDVHTRDALSLGQGTIRGALAARNVGGGITQTGALRVEGVANVNAGYGVGAGAITLDHAGNDFRGAVTLVGGAARVRDTDGLTLELVSVTSLDATSGGALSLGGGNVGGDFTATSTAGGITQQGAITVDGTSSIDAGTGDILLTDAGNHFTGAVNLEGGAVAIDGGAALDLGAVDATSLLATATRIGLVGDVTTSGGQTYDGALVLREDVALNAGGAVDFLSTVDGAHRLSVDAGGVVAFDAAVGGGAALAGLDVDALGFEAASTVDVGDLSIAVQAGGITQQDAFHVAGNASFDAGVSAITLMHADNDFTGPAALRGGNVRISDRNALTLGTLDVGALAATSVGALGLGSGRIADALTAGSGGGAISQAGALSVGGVSTIDAGAGAITLDNAGNDFASLVRLEGGAAVVRDANALYLDTLDVAGLTATSGGTLSLGSGNIRGDLVASSAGDITQQRALVVTGTGDIDAGSGRIQLGHANNDFQSTLHLAGASATLVDANALSLGVLDLGGFDVRVTDTLDLGRGSVAGNLIAMSQMGGIRQSGALSVAGTSTIAATRNIELTSAGNDFVGAVSIQSQGATVSLRDANALHLAHGYSIQDFNVSTGGALNLGSMWVGRSLVAFSATGGITQTAELWAGGTSSIDAGTGDITLTNAGNDFNGIVNLAGGNVTVGASDALSLGTLDVDALSARSQGALGLGQGVVGGDLSASSQGGAITQTGALSVGGASSIDAGAGDINLTNAGNDFTGAVDLTGGAVAIADANALVLGDVDVASLRVQAGTIGLSGDVSTVGDQRYDADVVLGADVALSSGGDVGFGATVDGAHRLSVHADGAVVFDAAVGGATALAGLDVDASSFDAASGISVDGGLSVAVRTGDIAQSGAWRVGGNADFDAGAGAITLGNAGNDFGGAVHLSGGAAVVRDANALQLGTLDVAGLTVASGGALSLGSGLVGGNLSATSQGGGIRQAGALLVAGASTIDAGAGGISLDHAGNDFVGAVDLAGGAAVVRDANALRLGTLDVASLHATATTIDLATDVTTSGDQTYDGVLVLDADLALTAGGNVGFGSAVDGAHRLSVDAGGAVVFGAAVGGGTALAGLDVDAGSFSAASTIAVDGDLSIAARTGGITQSGAFRVGGNADFDAGTGAIALGNAGNDFAGTVALRGGIVDIRDRNALSLGSVDATSLHATAATIGLASDVTTSGGQTYDGVLVLDADLALTAGGNVGFGSAVDGAHRLSVDAGGAVVFGAAVGGGTALAGLDVDSGSFSAASTISVDGDLSIAARTGGIAQSGAFRVGGNADFDAGAGAGGITLTDAGNDFAGLVGLRGGAVAITDANALQLGTLDVASLHATAATIDLATDVTTSGDQTYDGALVLDADLALSAGGNVGFGSTVDGAHRLSVGAGGAVVFGAAVGGGTALAGLDVDAGTFSAASTISVDGDLSIAARTGGIAQSGSFRVGGNADFDAGAGGITLTDAGNDFVGAVSLRGAAVTISDRNALTLAALEVGALNARSVGALSLGNGSIAGALVASGGGGAITQAGALSVGGVSSIDAGAGAITLSNAGNDFGGAVHLSGGAAVVRDANALQLGTLDVVGLTATSGGALSLGSGLVGGNLVATSQGGGIRQTGALLVAGASTIDAGAGAIVLDDAGNDFAGPVGLSGDAIALRDRNDLTLSQLRSAPGGDVHVVAGGALALPAQAIDAGSGSLHLAAHGGTLTTRGTLAGGDVSLHGAGGVVLAGDVLADGRLHLESGGDLVQSGGRVAAALLTGSAAGEARLAGANRIAELGAFSASRIHLANAGPLAVTGPVDARAGSLLLALSEGDLAIDGRVSAADIRLEVAGGIAQGADGQLVAGTLSGRAGGAVNLGDGQRFIDNQIERIGDFTAHAGFSMTNGRSLTLSSLNGSDFTIDAGEAEFYVNVDGDLRQDGTDWLYNGRGTWVASGGIGLQEAPIHVMGVESQVATPGVPPAYFNAVRRDGSLLPIVGDAVNVPTAVWAGRAQTSSNRQVAYVDVGADASNYRGYGLVEPGVRLPEDQQPECDPDFPGPDCADTAMTTLHDAFWQAAAHD